jgi:hypothetical protein
MAFLTYTITNVALLCCLAGVIGTVSNLFLISRKKERDIGSPDDDHFATNPILTGLLRGFLIYILYLAGVYAATSAPFSAPTPDQYARMAGTVSLLSFIISFEPDFLKTIIGIASKKYAPSGGG